MAEQRPQDWPPSLVPRFLSRTEAARYLGVAPGTFDDEVASGQWPAPRRRGAKGTKLTWDRHLLDHFADQASGLDRLPLPAAAAPSDLRIPTAAEQAQAQAEAAALSGVRNATPVHRPKYRQPKAA